MNKQQQQQQPPNNLPTFLVILHIAIRISIANSPPITDCDEVFNYWEPLHYLQYGYGMQTWEYAPQFALRTYAYLLPMLIVTKGYSLILQNCPQCIVSFLTRILLVDETHQYDNLLVEIPVPHDHDQNYLQHHHEDEHKLLIFHLLRATLSLATAISEIRLIQSLPKKYTAILIWITLLTSTGMYHVAPAYLPSATVMIFLMNSVAEQLRGRLHRAIQWGILACLMTGWPFCGILFVPLGFYAMFSECRHGESMRSNVASVVGLVGRVFGWSVVVQGVVMMVDYVYYGKMVSPTWNIFVYNTGWGREDGINRDELYGVEDVMYYVKNLALNWNILALCAVCSLPLLLCKRLWQTWFGTKRIHTTPTSSTESEMSKTTMMMVILLPMYLWLAIVFSRPHKEERFLFPIYPLIAMGAVVFLDECLLMCGISTILATKTNHSVKTVQCALLLLTILPCALVSMSRSMVLTDGYTAPLRVYSHLHRIVPMDSNVSSFTMNDDSTFLVCTGGEWYRFPSSFYLPTNARLAFVKSSFDGQLPQPFTVHGSRVVESLSSVHQRWGRFNDLNQQEMDRYVDIQDCAFAIELVVSDKSDHGGTINNGRDVVDPEIVTYMEQDDNGHWETVVQEDFLNVETTPFLHRILYLPLFRQANYKKYTLYKRRNNNNNNN
jgi:Alg9-like mannosyltransferase family.